MLLLLPLGRNIDSTIKYIFLQKSCYVMNHFMLYYKSVILRKTHKEQQKSFFSSRNINF